MTESRTTKTESDSKDSKESKNGKIEKKEKLTEDWIEYRETTKADGTKSKVIVMHPAKHPAWSKERE